MIIVLQFYKPLGKQMRPSMIGLKNEVILRDTRPLAPVPVSRDGHPSIAWTGDGDDFKIVMFTCPTCGGRGGTFDFQGNWIVCQTCGGSGQVNY